ncbi:MAG TPA: hypothetical protein PKD54_06315 [Pirellulaceae bacterium]|nr:hypothetical protein [Pirellulaceae bacterium]
MEFEFRRPTRQCCVTDQPIRPGQDYYTALRETESGELERLDWSSDAWPGPPEGCIAWWQSRIPSLDEGRVYWAPNDVLRSVFQYYVNQSGQPDIAYVMGLLMMRKRLLQYRETIQRDGQSWLVLYDPKQQTTVELAEVTLESFRAMSIQAELAEKLFASHSAMDAEDDSGRE